MAPRGKKKPQVPSTPVRVTRSQRVESRGAVLLSLPDVSEVVDAVAAEVTEDILEKDIPPP